MTNKIVSVLLPIFLCHSVIAMQKKHIDYKPKKNNITDMRRGTTRLKYTHNSFGQMLSYIDLDEVRPQIPAVRLTNRLELLFYGINIGWLPFSRVHQKVYD